MGLFARLLSFDRPMGPALVQVLYLLALTWIGLRCVLRMIEGVADLGDSFMGGLWQIVSAPFIALVAILFVRVLAEFARAVFRMDTSLHELVTGRAAPGPLKAPASPDQSED